MNGLQLNALRAAAALIDRSRMAPTDAKTALLTTARDLIDEVISFDAVLEAPGFTNA